MELIVRKNHKGFHLFAFFFCMIMFGMVIYFVSIENANKAIGVESIFSIIDEESGEEEQLELDINEIKNEQIATKMESEKFSGEREEDIAKRIIDDNKPMVALTFDDGPSPNTTLKLIEILNQYQVKATFFDIGFLMEEYPQLVKAEMESGCEVGGHSYSHANLDKLSKEEIEEEMIKVEEAYQNATGKELALIRPPYGNANDRVRKTVEYPLIKWSVDSLDWKLKDKDKILSKIYETQEFDGKIVLMHGIYDTTLKAVEELIPELLHRGYQFVTISEMAETKGYHLEKGKLYCQF